MENYKLRDFAKWARKQHISDESLLEVVSEMSRGLLGDRLGAHIYKKRIKVGARGKRSGGRVIVLYKYNELSNISANEEKQLRIFADEFSKYSSIDRARLKRDGKLVVIEESEHEKKDPFTNSN